MLKHIITAQPGWAILEPVYEDDPKEIIDAHQSPVIAWAFPKHEEDDEALPYPVTIEGVHNEDSVTLLRPDGWVERAHERSWPDIPAWIEWLKSR